MGHGDIVALGDGAVSLVGETDRERDWLASFFGGNRVEPGTNADLTVAIRATGELAPIPGAPSTRQGPTRRSPATDSIIISHDLGAVATVTGRRLDLAVSATSPDPARAVRHLLFSGLSWWLQQRGQTLLHAAMIARNAEAAVILGDSGRGKSTAALAAMLDGWDVCADDLVIVDTIGGVARAWGIPKQPTIENSIARRIGLSSHPLIGDERGRVALSARGLSSGWRTVRLVVVVGHHEAEGALRPLDHAAALGAIGSASLESGSVDALRRQWRTLAALAGVGAVMVLHAADSDVRLERAAELLAEAWNGHRANVRVGGQ